MALNKKTLEKQALKAITEHNLFFVTDLVAYLPCSRATFYNLKMDKLDTLKEAIEQNKIKTTHSMKNKWYNSDNPTLQVALMKIIGTDEVRKRLTQSHQDLTTGGEPIHITIKDYGTDD